MKLSAQLSRRLRTQPIRIDLEMDCPRAIRISRAARKCGLWERDCRKQCLNVTKNESIEVSAVRRSAGSFGSFVPAPARKSE